MISQGSPKYVCSECDYITSQKYNWNRHIKTTNHIFNISTKVIFSESPENESTSNDHIWYVSEELETTTDTDTDIFNKNCSFSTEVISKGTTICTITRGTTII